MVKGKKKGGEENFSDDNVFVNYQLTDYRGKLAYQLRKAKKDGKVKKYAVNQNGEIRVKRTEHDQRWVLVKNKVTLDEILNHPR